MFTRLQSTATLGPASCVNSRTACFDSWLDTLTHNCGKWSSASRRITPWKRQTSTSTATGNPYQGNARRPTLPTYVASTDCGRS
ncbi:hypothetical protein DPMN_038064 [Dreissena polymorpha]|uniref:Uncharacterized protein n=1 Tax=Dreissena polymorpha TaxID=45954 RepID=A0A9D4MGE7_DREPO|nr:hypothetical protein DPMN_038064 [Dreissena polymorpha]